MEIIEIDGSRGEGGGQIIRTAITLATITGKSLVIENIRSKRKNPGLRPQHYAAIQILGKMCNAKIDGLSVGSTKIKFEPGKMQDSYLKLDVGTAGSIPLILQAIIPSASICKKNLEIQIKGGTDVSWSPTYNYTNLVLREAYRRIGIDFQMNLIRRGYYPKGGGDVQVSVTKSSKLNTITLHKRKTRKAKLVCNYYGLPVEQIEQEISKIKNIIETNGFSVDIEIDSEKAVSEGGSLLLYSIDENSIIGVDTLYNRKSQTFEKEVSMEFLKYNYGVDDNLADMLVVPASVSKGISVFQVDRITEHLETNLYVASKITGCKYGIGRLDKGFEVRIEGISNSSI